MSSVPWGPPTVLSLCKAVREGGGDEIRGLCGCLYPTQSTTRRKCQEFSLMATCHNVLSNLHTAPAGLQTRDMGSAVPLPGLCLRPYKSLLGHTQSKPLSPIPTSGIALFEFSQGARPDLAPDSWRSGTQTWARQSGKRRGASSPEPQLHQRSGRTRPPEGGTTHRAGWNPGAARWDVSSHASGRRGHPRQSRPWASRRPPGTPRRSVGRMWLLLRSTSLTSASCCCILVAGGATQPRAGTRSRSPLALARSVRRGGSSSSGGRSGAARAGPAHGKAGAAALQAGLPTPTGERVLSAPAAHACSSFSESQLSPPGSGLWKSHGLQEEGKEMHSLQSRPLALSPPPLGMDHMVHS